MTREAFGKALAELGKDDRVFVIDTDEDVSTKSSYFREKHPDRFVQAGIAEQNAVGIGAGLAASGKVPFVVSYACFLCTRAYDQIRMSVAFPKTNVKVCGTHGGIGVGCDGPSHHAIDDIGLMRMLLNMTVVQPADANEARLAAEEALRFHGPMYIRLTRQALPDLGPHEFKIGKGVVLREGGDVSLVATGSMVHTAVEAAKILEKQGVSADVINIHTIKPIDSELLAASAKKTGRVVTCEDHGIGGLYSAVSEVLSEACPALMKGVYARSLSESGTPEELYERQGLTAENIAKVALGLVKS
jgi:transketolase